MKKTISIFLAFLTLFSLLSVNALAVSKGSVIYTGGYTDSENALENNRDCSVHPSIWSTLDWYDFPYYEEGTTSDMISARMKTAVVGNVDNNTLYCFIIEVTQSSEMLDTYKNYDSSASYDDSYKLQNCVELFMNDGLELPPDNTLDDTGRQLRFNIGGIMSPVNPTGTTNNPYQHNFPLQINRFSVIKTDTGYTYHIVAASNYFTFNRVMDYPNVNYPIHCDIVAKAVDKNGNLRAVHSSVNLKAGETNPELSMANYGRVNYNLDNYLKYDENYVEPTVPAFKKGDVNNDTLVNIADAMMLFKNVSGSLESLKNPMAADVNNDSKINIADAMKLYKFVSGQIPSL